MLFEVTALYAAIIAIVMAVLSTIVAVLRSRHEVALGEGKSGELALPIRRFGNLTEYAPIVILLLLLMENAGVSAGALHAYGSVFVVLRIIHPLILFDTMGAPIWKKAGRFVSGAGTALLMLIGAGVLLVG